MTFPFTNVKVPSVETGMVTTTVVTGVGEVVVVSFLGITLKKPPVKVFISPRGKLSTSHQSLTFENCDITVRHLSSPQGLTVTVSFTDTEVNFVKTGTVVTVVETVILSPTGV